jgi:hypothetical protein
MNSKKSRRFLVRFENPDTGMLEPPDVEEADYTKVFVVQVVKSVNHDAP